MISALIDRLETVGHFVQFAWRTTLAMPRALASRPMGVLHQFERVALGGVPIILAAGASIGLVTWIQTRRLLVTYGVEATLPSVLAVAVLVETGPMLASLLVAGRMGAGLAAEFGSMKLAEEVDAHEILGAPILPALVAPRVLACTLAVPLLTILLDACAILGGMAAELSGGTLTLEIYSLRTLDFLRLSDIIPSTLKTAVFGWAVGLIACWTGLEADRSTESVGRAATLGVVRAMIAVFLANVFIVPILQIVTRSVGWSS